MQASLIRLLRGDGRFPGDRDLYEAINGLGFPVSHEVCSWWYLWSALRLVSRSFEHIATENKTPSIFQVLKFGVQATFASMLVTAINSIKEVFRHGNRTN